MSLRSAASRERRRRRRRRRRRARRGIVLLAALIVLGVVGALLVAGYFAARTRMHTAVDEERSVRLRAGARGGLAALVVHWDSAARFSQPIARTDLVPVAPAEPAQRITAVVTRLSPWSYAGVVRTVDANDSSLTARAASVIAIDAPTLPLFGALIARRGVRADGSLTLVGPDSAACESAGAVPAKLVVPPGVPAPPGAIVMAAAGDDSTYERFGNVTWDTLASRADVVMEAGGAVGTPRGNVTYDTGSLELTGGAGRGVLLVDGMLRITGDVSFEGVIVASGGIEVSGRASVTGIALAGGDSVPSVFVKPSGALELRSDPCVVTEVTWHAGRPVFPPRTASPVTP